MSAKESESSPSIRSNDGDNNNLVSYFAIGSMMNPISLANRGIHPAACRSQPAELLEYRLGFFGPMGYADAVPCDGASFHGVIHYVKPDQMEILDKIELFYTRHTDAQARLYSGETVPVTVYSRGPRDITEDSIPKERYLDVMIAGAEHFGVKPSYIEWLKRHEKIPRPTREEYLTFGDGPTSIETRKVAISKEEMLRNDGFDGRPLWISVNGKVLEAHFPPEACDKFEFNRQRFQEHGRTVELHVAKIVYDPKFGNEIKSMQDVTPEWSAFCEHHMCEFLGAQKELDYWKIVGRLESSPP